MKKITAILSSFFITGIFNFIFCQQLPVVNLAAAFAKPSGINLSDFIESISYVSLSTKPESLIDLNPDIIVTKDYILSATGKRCLEFKRESGTFIREIGKYGRGPGEYRSTYLSFLNGQSSVFYMQGWNGSFAKYTLDGVFRGNLKIPFYDDSMISSSFPDRFSYLNDSILVCSYYINDGTEEKSILVFNDRGKTIKIFPNQNKLIKKQDRRVGVSGEILFYRIYDKLYCHNVYNDTIFQVDRTRKVPSIVVDRGKYCPPFESRWWAAEKKQKANFINLTPLYFEDKRFILFSFYQNRMPYFVLYNKLSKALKVTSFKQGIKNDIDGFMDLSFKGINDSGELYCIIQPIDLMKWIKENPDKFRRLKPELQKLKEVQIEDNPVVVIAKLKM